MARVIRHAGSRRLTFQRQLLFWLGALLVFGLLLYVFSPILLPFVAGMALAYALDPVADWMQRRGLSRVAATLIIVAVFLLLFAVILLALVPVLINQTAGLIAKLPDLVIRLEELLKPLLSSRAAQALGIDPSSLRDSLAPFASQVASWATAVLFSIWSGGKAVVAVLSLFVITPVVAFYLLYDWDRMMTMADGLLPRDHAPTIRRLAAEISRAIAGFVRGQGLVCIILGIFYALALAVVGLNFGLLIGIMAGILSFIPFVGSLTGFVVSVAVAAVQFWPDWIWIAVTAAVFFAGQFLEGYVLQPRLVGGSIGLHPVWLMFALFAFGLLFGFVGTLIAVPAAAAVAVLVRFAVERYRSSAYYSGADGLAAVESESDRMAGE